MNTNLFETAAPAQTMVFNGQAHGVIEASNISPPSAAAIQAAADAPGVNFSVSGALDDSFNLSVFNNLSVSTGASQIDISDQEFSGGVAYFPVRISILGIGFTYDSEGDLTGGTVTGLSVSFTAPPVNGISATASLNITQLNASVLDFANILLNGDGTSAVNGFFGGPDIGTGVASDDILRGFSGGDTLSGQGGYDTILGGDGSDQIYGLNATGSGASPTEQNYLRGEAGDDSVTGAAGFDDINGYMGIEVIHGAGGDDWVVGGKDNDSQTGDAGDDIVWGNLGNATLEGGAGNGQVRGGQGDDVVNGGAGTDFVSGARGNDTITGGAGADLFHGSQDAGIDRVLDFHLSEGDRVMLDPGTTYTLSQVGADTVIDMGGGNQMILVGVQMSPLTSGWIFAG